MTITLIILIITVAMFIWGKVRADIVALTAFAMTGDQDMFLKAGMDGYLSKPVSLNKMKQAIDQALALHADK